MIPRFLTHPGFTASGASGGRTRLHRPDRHGHDDVAHATRDAPGVYRELMPYRDPRTAGPVLWALYHQTGEDFEVSVVSGERSTPWSKGLEAPAIALCPQEQGHSPTVGSGRMPARLSRLIALRSSPLRQPVPSATKGSDFRSRLIQS
jgi:hypothetical protein